jgi:hypothetical protein
MIALKTLIWFFAVSSWLANVVCSAEPASVPDERVHMKFAELEQHLHDSPNREVVFRELRSSPFRKTPVELEGVIRVSQEGGMSIEYPEKKSLILIDRFGVLMRKYSDDGEIKEKAIGLKDSHTISLLQALIDFNANQINSLFQAEWQAAEDGWSILLYPRQEEDHKLERVSLLGTGKTMKQIDIDFGGNKSLSIFPLEEMTRDAFSAHERIQYFRGDSQ